MWKAICIAGVLLAALNVQAVEFVQAEQFVSPEGETLSEEIWISAQTITIDGDTSNDLFAVASAIDLNGTFHGDIWGCGKTIRSAGIFRNDVRLAARTAQISGTLHGSLVAAGTTVKIERTAILYNDLLCLGENVITEGSIAGDVRIVAQRVTLGGQIKGDAFVTAQEIVVLPNTIINGNLIYTAPKELVLSPSVMLGGTLTRKLNPAPVKNILKPNLVGHFLFGLAALVTGLVFNGLFPRYAGGSLNALRTSRGRSMLIGFVSLFMLPVTAFLLLFTFVGTPLSMLIFLFYLILLYLSKIVVALAIGSAILRRKEFSKQKVAAPLALGLLIIYALTSFVAASMVLNILITILGLGALLLALFKKPVLVVQTPDAINETNPGE